MGLINLQTDLKSLKFGKDRPGGGDSGQPYIQTPIPDNQSDPLPLLTNDSTLRGGINAPLRALKDVERLTKYLFNTNSPSGYLFIAKENLLSRVSPKTEASSGAAYGGGAVNAGIYTPLSTLAQAGVGFLGTHLNQKGIDPTGLIPALSLNKYEDIVKKNNNPETNQLFSNPSSTIAAIGVTGVTGGSGVFGEPIVINLPPIAGIATNRLLGIFKNKQHPANEDPNVLEYGGGPGSILGIGKTRIKFAEYRTGANNFLAKSNESDQKYFYKGGIKLHAFDLNSIPNYKNYLGASNKYKDNFDKTISLLNNDITENGKLINNPSKELGFNSIIPPNPDVISNKSTQDKVPPPKDDSTYDFTTYKKKYKVDSGKGIEEDKDRSTSEKTTKGNFEDQTESLTSKDSRKERDIKINNKSNLLKNISENSKYSSLSLDNDQYTNGKKEIFTFDPSSTDGDLINQTESSKSKDSKKRDDPTLVIDPLLKNISKNDKYNNNVRLDNSKYTNTKDVITFDPRSTKGDLIKKLESNESKTSRKRPLLNDGKRYNNFTAPGTSTSKFVGTFVQDISNYQDTVNTTTLYSSILGNPQQQDDENDLIPFRIGIINPNDPGGELVYMTFRSYIDSFSDAYTSEWKSQKYIGRGEKFYKYGGFDRNISMAFTVVAMAENEVGYIYSKLNYLASSLAPTYTPLGYMAGNLCRMTVGDYINEQYGFISSLTYTIPTEASWDVRKKLRNPGVDPNTSSTGATSAAEYEKLPYMIKITGLKFTPIHNFRPEIVPNKAFDKGLFENPSPTQRYITNELLFK